MLINRLITILLVVLFIVISGELFYLIYYQRVSLGNGSTVKTTPSPATAVTEHLTLSQGWANQINQLVSERLNKDHTGVAQLLITTKYKGVLTQLGSSNEYFPQTEVASSFVIEVNTDIGKKGFYFTKDELNKIKYYRIDDQKKLVSANESDIKVGDPVEFTIAQEVVSDLNNNTVSAELVKTID